MTLKYLSPRLLKAAPTLSPEAEMRLRWFDWYVGHGKNARLTCRYFGIVPDTFYRWKRRFNPYNLLTLEDDKRTRRPKKLRSMTTSCEVINRVIMIRKEDREKSKYEINEELKRKGIVLGTSTIQKIINRHPGLLNTQHIKKVRSHRKRAITRIRAAHKLKDTTPGSLVQIDTKHLYILGKRFYVFAAIDCMTRIGYISAFETGSSLSGAQFLHECIRFFPFIIKAVQTDNGSEYLLNFHQTCQQKEITHYFSYPHCPKQNGRAERFIQTATYEFFNWQDDLIDDIKMLQEKCYLFIDKYNTKRYHQVLQYKTPMEFLQDYQS